MSLLFSQPASATFFSDALGFLFTVGTYPIQLILGSTKAPFFKKQNPLIEKDWEIEAREKIIYKEIVVHEKEKPNELTAETPAETAAANVKNKTKKIEEDDKKSNPENESVLQNFTIPFISFFCLGVEIICDIIIPFTIPSSQSIAAISFAILMAVADIGNRYYKVVDSTKSFGDNLKSLEKVFLDFCFSKAVVFSLDILWLTGQPNPRFIYVAKKVSRLIIPNLMARYPNKKLNDGFLTWKITKLALDSFIVQPFNWLYNKIKDCLWNLTHPSMKIKEIS
jgi:hypothetical protein